MTLEKILKGTGMELIPVTPHCGAEVRGVDLSMPLDKNALRLLNEGLSEYCVLFFRDQKFTPQQQKDLGLQFGELHLHPVWPWLVEGHPEIMEIRADANTTRIAGESWHSDVSCDPEPPMGSILYMLETPPSGGDTLFASMYAAYDTLSAAMRNFLHGLTAIHDGAMHYQGGYDNDPDPDKVYPTAEHPVVRTHPVSGRKALYVNRTFTSHIPALERSESDAVLEMLYQHLEQPRFQCRFNWQPGSVAFWDNRCAQHQALWDYYPHRRYGWRVTVKGDRPV